MTLGRSAKRRILILTGLLTILTAVFSDDHADEGTGRAVLAAQGTEGDVVRSGVFRVKVYRDAVSEKSYLFLPSGADPEEARKEAGTAGDVEILASTNLPSIWIDTDEEDLERILTSTEAETGGEMRIFSEEGEELLHIPLKRLKTRGNATFANYDKKQFYFKTQEAVRLFGMNRGKKWVLTSNVTDRSLVRNALAMRLAESLSIAGSREGQFVDLYINGTYQGNYYLCEKIDVDPGRLDITDLEEKTEALNEKPLSSYEDVWTDTSKAKDIPVNPSDLTGGYLIEREFYERLVLSAQSAGGYFITEGGDPYVIKSPEYPSREQLTYIENLMQEAEEAIASEDGFHPETGKYYTEYIDIDSFAAKYLLEEMTKNYDGGTTSAYYYKDIDAVSTKLKAGPAWDYDLAFGNSPYYLGDIDTSAVGLTLLYNNVNSTRLYERLMEHEDFASRVRELYRETGREAFRQYSRKGGDVDQLREKLAASAAMDSERWAEQYQRTGETQDQATETEEVRQFIAARNDYLDTLWN